MSDTPTLDEFLGRVPPPEEIRQRLAANLQERAALRQLLKIAERIRKSEELRSCGK